MNNLRIPPLVLCVSAYHIFVACIVLVDPSAMNTSAVFVLRNIARTPIATATILAAASALAIAGILLHTPRRVLLFVPQHYLLSLVSIGAVDVIRTGHYADGVARSHAFIAADQSLHLCVFIFYTFALAQIAGVIPTSLSSIAAFIVAHWRLFCSWIHRLRSSLGW